MTGKEGRYSHAAHRAAATEDGKFVAYQKISLQPASTRTVARMIEIVRTGNRRLPRCEPTVPAITAATARIQANFGIGLPLETSPISPAMEFTRMNNAETAAAPRIEAQWQNNKSGVRKI